MNPIDRVLLGLSYVVLVLVVVGGGLWVQRQLAAAHDERCALAQLEVELTRTELAAVGVEMPDDVDVRLLDLVALVRADC